MSGVRSELLPLPGTRFFPILPPFDRTFLLNGVPLPGKWTLISAKKNWGWLPQQPSQMSGGFVLQGGEPLVTVRFKGEIWDNLDFLQYSNIIRPTLLSTAAFTIGPLTAALSITHPEVNALNVAAVVVYETNPFVQQEGGLWTTELELLQFRPPRVVKKRPDQQVPEAPQAGTFDVPTAVQAEIAQGAVEMNQLSAQNELLKAH